MRDFQHGINTFPSHLFLRREYMSLYSYEWFTKSDDGKVGVRFVHLECDYSRKRIRRHDVLLQINQNYDRIEKTT